MSTSEPNERRASEDGENEPDPPADDPVETPPEHTDMPAPSGETASDAEIADPEVQHE